MITAEKVRRIEKLLIDTRDREKDAPFAGRGIIPTPAVTQDYASKKASLTYTDYTDCGEQHYFLARVLVQIDFFQPLAYFSAQQMVETYLKAMLCNAGRVPRETHDLLSLLTECRQAAPADPFISGEHVEVIVSLFDPFNEIGRYPIAKKGPEHNPAYVLPYVMWFMDYFVFEMRKLLPDRNGHSSMFSSDIHFTQILNQIPLHDIERLFKEDNINFE